MKRPTLDEIEREITALDDLKTPALQQRWRELFKIDPPPRIRSGFLRRAIAYRLQELVHGGLKPATKRQLRSYAEQARLRRMGTGADGEEVPVAGRRATLSLTRQRIALSPGARLMREWNGVMQVVEVTLDGFVWRGTAYRTLSAAACAITGTKWSGPKFFGLGNGSRSAATVSERSLVRQLAGGAVDADGGANSTLRENQARSAGGFGERAQVRGLAGGASDADGGAGRTQWPRCQWPDSERGLAKPHAPRCGPVHPVAAILLV